jgi:hypothetical protein
MSSTFTYNEWGFRKENGYYSNPGEYKKLVMPVDDCARACEQESQCKSITYWTSPRLGDGQHEQCFLNQNQNQGSIVSSRDKISYTKGALTKSSDIETRIKANPLWPSSQISGRDDIVKYLNANTPENFQESPLFQNWRTRGGYCDQNTNNGQYPTSYQADDEGNDGNNRSCYMAIPSASSCALPGKVTVAYNSNTTDTGGPSQSDKYAYRLRCDYKSLDPNWVSSKWDYLSDFLLDYVNVSNAKTDYCNSLSSIDMYRSQRCIQFYTQQGNLTIFYRTILQKLKNETNWWDDASKCNMLANITITDSSRSTNESYINDVINSLPTTGWSDDLVKALNSIKNANVNISQTITTKIDDESRAYCDASNGDSNSKCGCRNAIKYGKARQCTNNIEGCPDVKRSYDLIDKAKGIDAAFGRQIEQIYDPNFDSEACKSSISPGSNILNIGATQRRDFNIAACFNAIENSGTISGDVSTRCNASVQLYNQQQSSSASSTSGGGGGSSSNSEKYSFIKGETSGIKNDYWLVALVLCCMCFLIIGVGLAAVLI